MKQETPMQEFAKAFRRWDKDWDLYRNSPIDLPKPQNIDDFLAPHLEKEKQAIIDAYSRGITKGKWDVSDKTPNQNGEIYFNNKYNTNGN